MKNAQSQSRDFQQFPVEYCRYHDRILRAIATVSSASRHEPRWPGLAISSAGLGPKLKMISASGKNQQLSCSFQRFRPSAEEFLAAAHSVGPDGGIGTDVIAHAGAQFRADPEFAPGARAL